MLSGVCSKNITIFDYMHTGEVLKKATALKCAEGYPSALNFLCESYDQLPEADKGEFGLSDLLNKIYTYLPYDKDNPAVKSFIQKRINENIDTTKLLQYYWIQKDYELFRQTIEEDIKKETTGNNNWQYCYNMFLHKQSLVEYFQVKGLEQVDNAYQFLFNLYGATTFDLGSELMMFDYNFHNYHMHVRYKFDLTEFTHPDKLIPLSNGILAQIPSDNDEQKCLDTIGCKVPANEVSKMLHHLLFVGLQFQFLRCFSFYRFRQTWQILL